MFGTQPYARNQQCACGRDPKDAQVTRFSSITGTYSFHRCVCGMEWTERVANPDGREPASNDIVLEAHRQFKDFHGLMRALHPDSPRNGRRTPSPGIGSHSSTASR